MEAKKAWPVRVVLALANVAVAVFVLADEIARPLYRPAYGWIVRQAVVSRMEAAVARLPPYGILFVLAVPFVGVEPLKVVGVYLMGTGHFIGGLATLVFAYLASFALIERIYHAGRGKLLTIAWFARGIGFVSAIRDRVLARARETAAYRAAAAAARIGRSVAAQARERIGRLVARTA